MQKTKNENYFTGFFTRKTQPVREAIPPLLHASAWRSCLVNHQGNGALHLPCRRHNVKKYLEGDPETPGEMAACWKH
jgi:hypothetical protein